jgi:hypothetical protein
MHIALEDYENCNKTIQSIPAALEMYKNATASVISMYIRNEID